MAAVSGRRPDRVPPERVSSHRRPMERVYRAVVGHARVVLGGLAVLTAILALFAWRVPVDSSITPLLPRNDPNKAFNDWVVRQFGSDDIDIVGVLADDVYAEATLRKIDRITTAAGRLAGVQSVLSLTNAVDPIADVYNPPPLVQEIPTTPEAAAALRAKVQGNPLYVKNLVAPDGRGAAINIFYRADLADDARYAIDRELETIVARERGPEEIHLTGISHIRVKAQQFMRHDVVALMPLSILVVAVVLALSFRTVRGVMLPLGTVTIGVVWTVGCMGLAGNAITMGTLVLPSLLVVIGSSYATHVVARYYLAVEARNEAGVPAAAPVGPGTASPAVGAPAAFEALRQAALPVTVSALATGIGFSALLVNRIEAVRDLGLFAIVGIAALLVLCLAFIPSVLALLPERGGRGPGGTAPSRLGPWLRRIGTFGVRHRRLVFAGSVAAFVASLWQVPSILVDTNFLSYFPPRSELRIATDAINRRIAGTVPFYIVVDGGGPGGVVTLEALGRIRALQGFLTTLPGVDASISIVDYLELLDRALQTSGGFRVDEHGKIVEGGATTFWEEPGQLREVLELVRLNPGTFRSVVTEDLSRANLLVRTSLTGSNEIAATVARIEAYAGQRLGPQLTVRPTGSAIVLTGTTDDVVQGQVESITVAMVVIFLVMSILFLSAKVGFVAMVPNTLPVVIFFGLMGWSGIMLNLGTSIIAAIALGIAVDNTIHYMVRFNAELRTTYDQEGALLRALETIGRPIVYTSFALTLGFLTVCRSRFVPLQSFGLLSAATMLAALVTNVLLLPALLATTKIVTLWDLVFVKLGRAPHRTIPLLRGLGPSQARIAVLLGTLRTFARGDTVIRKGDEGNEMYVILGGTVEVLGDSGGTRRLLRRQTRGDVIGEMGLVRGSLRTADIVAVEDVEVLAVDEKFLHRLQRRYPKIAAQVFLNLTRILSDRLQQTTEQLLASPVGAAAPERGGGGAASSAGG
jgi:predicted RND superfamily exporter protein